MWELLEGLVHLIGLIEVLAKPENQGKWYWWLALVTLIVLLFGGCYVLMIATR